MSFGEFMKKMRKQENMSQRELADKVGVVEYSISRYETDKVLPQLDIAEKIVNALGCRLEIVKDVK